MVEANFEDDSSLKKDGGSKTICWIQLPMMPVVALRLTAGQSSKQQKSGSNIFAAGRSPMVR